MVSARGGPENREQFCRDLIRPKVLLSCGASKKLNCSVTQEGNEDPMTPAPISTT